MDVVYSPSQTLHHAIELDGGQLISSWESPIRAVRVAERLIRPVVAAERPHQLIKPDPLDLDLVHQIHHPDYVNFLANCWERWEASGRGRTQAMAFSWPALGMRDKRPDSLDGQLAYYSFTADCSIGPDTWTGVAVSAAAAQTAANLVADDSNDKAVAFALCRPPGHHAGKRQFGGYCYLNNAAIAAQALRNGGYGRVSVIDIDYHHGNGTQAIFYDRSDVTFVSIHADPAQEFPYFIGYGDETGEGDGDGANLNLPLPWGTGAEQWLATLEEALAWAESHQPGALVVSLGVDTFEHDPISKFKLPTSVYTTVGARLASLGLPTVLVMEGGYATDALADNVAGVIDGFEAVLG